MYPILDLNHVNNSSNSMNLSPTDILGTSAIGLLSFKQRLKDKSEINKLESIRRVNVSTKSSKETKSKRGATEERPNLPP